MAASTRVLLLSGVALAMLASVACSRTRRVSAPLPGAQPCLPPLEAPVPVGTPIAETVSHDFVLRVHDVRDILDLMPVIQLVGPGETTTVHPEDALISALLEELDGRERVITQMRGTDSGAVIVKAPVEVQEKVAAAIHRYRTELVRGRAADAFPGAPTGR